MQTTLAPEFAGPADGAEAEAILRRCVHCGFCLPTCASYRVLASEMEASHMFVLGAVISTIIAGNLGCILPRVPE